MVVERHVDLIEDADQLCGAVDIGSYGQVASGDQFGRCGFGVDLGYFRDFAAEVSSGELTHLQTYPLANSLEFDIRLIHDQHRFQPIWIAHKTEQSPRLQIGPAVALVQRTARPRL